MKIINDPQTKRQMEASKKIFGDEKINYIYLDITGNPFEPGRGDLLSYFTLNYYEGWRFLVNLNQVRDPFELLETAYKKENFYKTYIKFYRISPLLNSSSTSNLFDKKALF